jgi:hypothetical protein
LWQNFAISLTKKRSQATWSSELNEKLEKKLPNYKEMKLSSFFGGFWLDFFFLSFFEIAIFS